MAERLSELMLGKNLSIRESLFRIIVIIGQTAGIIALVKSYFNNGVTSLMFIQLFGIIAIFVATFVVFRLKKLGVGVFIVWVALVVIEFPMAFLLSGGIEGGAAVWMALGLFYVFMMFKGVQLVVFAVLSTLIDIAVFLLAYYHLAPVIMITDVSVAYVDSFFGIIAVGCVSGTIMLFQIRLYQKERDLAEKQKAELEKAAKTQSTFFASMSHEIRTPINSVIGLNEMIRRKTTDEEIIAYAENVQSSSKLLLDLVNDILDYAQLEQNRMKIINSEYSTVEMFRSVIDMIQVRMDEKNLKFQIHIDSRLPQYLIGDEKRVEQILINLLTNAVKYTGVGSVTLSATSERLENNKVKILMSVKDTGIGIRKEDLKKLYEAFERVDGKRNQNIEGSGLGLAITRQLLDLMDGAISVDSVYTKGTTFTVSFLQEYVNEKVIGRVDFTRRAQNVDKKYVPLFVAPEARILMVDDNDMNAVVMRELLSETGIQLEVASSGKECLEKTVEKYYHLILMDYMMPDMDGTDTLKAIRKQLNGLCKDSPIILMTASSTAEAQKLVEEYAFDQYIEKPIRAEQLEQELLRYLPESVIEQRNDSDMEDDSGRVVARYTRRKPVCITTDTVSDLPGALVEQLGIKIVPLYIRTDKGRFADTREIDSDNMQQYLTDKNTFAKADSLSVEEYEQFFADRLAEAENVIHITMASKSGKSYDVAVTAAGGFDHVHAVDSGQISCGEGLLTLYAAQLAREGCKVEEILQRLSLFKARIHTKFILPNADVFYRNGYTDRMTANICRLIGAHPVLSMSRSRIKVSGAYSGELMNSWRRFIKLNLMNKNAIDKRIVYITYTNLTIQQQEFIKSEILRQMPFEEVVMQKASFSTTCNAGIQSMGFSYLKKE